MSKKIQADMAVTVHAQYVRDISFENPLAPESLRMTASPAMDINLGMDARKLPRKPDMTQDLFEVVLGVRAEAKQGEQTIFIAEVEYAVLASIDPSVPEDKHHPLLLIEMPRVAFPYVRQILSDLTIKGGFPPLLLNPVDFNSLYQERFANGKTV